MSLIKETLSKIEKEEDNAILPSIPPSGNLDVSSQFHHLKVEVERNKVYPLKNSEPEDFNSRRNYVTAIAGLLFGFLLTRSD